MSHSIKQAVEELKRAREELTTFKQDTTTPSVKIECALDLVYLGLANIRGHYLQGYTLRQTEPIWPVAPWETIKPRENTDREMVAIGNMIETINQGKWDLLQEQKMERAQKFADDLAFLSTSFAGDIHSILLEQKIISAPTFQVLKRQEALKNNVSQAINNLAGVHREYILKHCQKLLDQRILRSPDLGFVILDSSDMPRKTGGVYLIWEKAKLLYVGQSQDIRQRLKSSHHVFDKNKHWVGAILEKDKGDRLYMETVLIMTLQPPENKQQNKQQDRQQHRQQRNCGEMLGARGMRETYDKAHPRAQFGRTEQGGSAMSEREKRTLDELWKARQVEWEEAKRLAAEKRANDEEEAR